MSKNYFSNVIGQEPVKRKLGFLLDSYYLNGVMPPLLLLGAKGDGKSTISRLVSDNLISYKTGFKRKFREFNASTMEDLDGFMQEIIKDNLFEESTIFIDEAHRIPKDIENALLTILDTKGKNNFYYKGQNFFIDFAKVTFIFATTECNEIFAPLVDRLEKVDLIAYTYVELGQIIQNAVKEIISQDRTYKLDQVIFKDHICDEIGSFARFNARGCVKLANHIVRHISINQGRPFGKKEWEVLKKNLDLSPLGLNRTEINLLQFLKQNGKTPLNSICSFTGFSPNSQKDWETFLVKQGLITILPRGREITPRGIKYLEELK